MPITLDPVHETDAAPLIAANRANRDFHAPWVKPFTDQPGFDIWFAAAQTPTNASLIARDNHGNLVGVFNFSQIFYGNFRNAYLGFYAMAASAGRGLMTEALHLACAHAFTTLALHRLEANIQPENIRSIALVRRAGFHREGFSEKYLFIDGLWRDHERWALRNDLP